MKGRINEGRKNVRRKSVCRWGGKSTEEKKTREKALDRVELGSRMENAPRNIPGILWEQFSRQPRNDVSFPLHYKSPEVPRLQQTATALLRASSALREPLTPETTSKQERRTAEREYPRSPPRRQTFHKIPPERAQEICPRC